MIRGEMETAIAIENVRRDIASRIRPVCECFAETEFVELVDQMARIEVKYRLRDVALLYDEAEARLRLKSAAS